MDYQKMYQEKLVSPERIVAFVENGWSCAADIAAAIPGKIFAAAWKTGKSRRNQRSAVTYPAGSAGL